MLSRKTVLLAFTGACAALAGCGDILGLDGYTEGDGSPADVTLDVNAGDAAKDAKTDAPISDAGNDVVLPSCGTGNVCVAPLPAGWAWAVYAPDSRPGCAGGYSSPTSVEEGIDAGAPVCGCGCTTTNPTCNTGNLTITEGNNTACNNTVAGQTDTAAGGCNALGASINPAGGMVSVTGPTPAGGSCTANPSQTIPAVGYDHQGQTCGFTGTPGDAGCDGGNVCVPNPAPFAACVSQAGNVACPTGFPNQHLVGTAVDDTRSCSGCSCTFDAGACTGTVTFATDGMCKKGKQNITANGTCQAAGGAGLFTYDYAPSTTASCAAGTASADGGVGFTAVTTVCCE